MSWFSRFVPRLRNAKTPARPAGPSITWAPAETKEVRPARKTTGPENFPRFHLSAGDQLDPRDNDRLAALRMRLRSAFTPSQPVKTRRNFAGRTPTLASLIRAIEDQRLHAVIYGERGIGKTSLLHILAEAASEARYQVIYISCGSSLNFQEMIRAAAANIGLQFHSDYGPTSAEAEQGGTFLDLLPDGPVTVRSATDLFSCLRGTRVLLVLDEFDRAESEELRFAVAELIKGLSDNGSRMQIVIGGVAENLTELVRNIPAIQRNLYSLQVPQMARQEVAELIRTGEREVGIKFDDEAVNLIAERCVGFPYLASLLASRSGLIVLDDGRSQVTGADVSRATGEAIEELRGRITRRSQNQVDECVRAGLLRPLGALAGGAQYANGRFNQANIDALNLAPPSKTLLENYLSQMAANRNLIAFEEDEFGPNFRFLETAVPPYLWLWSTEPERHTPAPI
jgi:Cdc6-like AAA superfamily ATPase